MTSERTLAVVSASQALETLKNGLPLKDVHIKEKLEVYGRTAPYDWNSEIVIENCVLEQFYFPCLQSTKPVSFLNSHFKNVTSYAPYFLAGLLIRNCTFDTYLDLQSGGHNKDGTEIRIEHNRFKSFVNFFDDWFEGPVIIQHNIFEQDTNVLAKNLMIRFDVAPIISDNTGKLDIEDEKEQLRQQPDA
jgi:hypothetical protein